MRPSRQPNYTTVSSTFSRTALLSELESQALDRAGRCAIGQLSGSELVQVGVARWSGVH